MNNYNIMYKFGGRLPAHLQDAKWVDPHRRDEKSTHPYSYSEFFLIGNREIIKQEGVSGTYSDRLQQWDYNKYAECWKRFPNKGFTNVSIEEMSDWMNLYYEGKIEEPIKVVAIAEGCNVSNGYPYWIIWYRAKWIKKP